MKWDADAWLSDERLRLCSFAARGLWTDVLSLMHKCDRRGYLQVASGKPYTPTLIARATGGDVGEVERLLQELKTSGVLSATDDGTIYSRRMLREEEQRRKEREKKARQRTGADVPRHVPDHVPRDVPGRVKSTELRELPPPRARDGPQEPTAGLANAQNGEEEELTLEGNGRDPPQSDDSLVVALWKACWTKAFGTFVEVRPGDAARLAAACAGRTRQACEVAFAAFLGNGAMQSKTVRTFLSAEVQRRTWAQHLGSLDPAQRCARDIAWIDQELAKWEPTRKFWSDDDKARVQALTDAKAKLEGKESMADTVPGNR